MSTSQSQHEKMQADYLWIRDHSEADSWGKARTHGQHYLYYHAPNKRERLEMIWRSIGKQYDWELEKFRLQKKFPDRGNKRRFLKNVFRFVKHPISYMYWKSYKLRQAKGRIITSLLAFTFVGMIWQYKISSFANAKKSHYILISGRNIEGNENINIGYTPDKLARQTMPLTQLLYSEVRPTNIIVSPSRDQNYRKYFEMRKKYGIKDE